MPVTFVHDDSIVKTDQSNAYSLLRIWQPSTLSYISCTADASGNLAVSSAGGGGGAVTVADGADVAQGNTADAAVVTDVSGTISGKLRGLVKIFASVWDSVGNRLKIDGSGVTQPISAVSLPLPAGASTSAKQPSIGIAGTASADVISVQGVSGGTAQPVSGTFWQATQPISGTVTSNIGTTNGLALDATLTGGTAQVIIRGVAKGTTVAGTLTSNPVDANTQALHVDGSKVTQPVSGTFWQATQPVSGTVTANQGGTWTVQPGNTANTVAWKVDGSAVTQPVSGTITSNQGTAASASSAWPHKLVDSGGVNVATVKAASTAIATTDVPLAVGLHPSSPLPAGTNAIGALTANQSVNVNQVGGAAVTEGQKTAAASIPVVLPSDANGATQATALFEQPRKLVTYQAVFRLAARPYALSNAFGAAGRKQYATIHHAATATKTVKIRHVWVALESSSAAALVVADLIRITTAPATGNPAITPSPCNPGDAAAEATCLALPTTAATEGAPQAMIEWNLGITGAGSTVNLPPPQTFVDLCAVSGIGETDWEGKVPTIRSGVLEGFAVTLDASAAATVKGFIVIEFTEE